MLSIPSDFITFFQLYYYNYRKERETSLGETHYYLQDVSNQRLQQKQVSLCAIKAWLHQLIHDVMPSYILLHCVNPGLITHLDTIDFHTRVKREQWSSWELAFPPAPVFYLISQSDVWVCEWDPGGGGGGGGGGWAWGWVGGLHWTGVAVLRSWPRFHPGEHQSELLLLANC